MTFEPTREELRCDYIRLRSFDAVAETYHWTKHKVKEWMNLYGIPRPWQWALTSAEVRIAWAWGRHTVIGTAEQLDVSSRVARQLLKREGIRIPRVGTWNKRTHPEILRVLKTWPPLLRWHEIVDSVGQGGV